MKNGNRWYRIENGELAGTYREYATKREALLYASFDACDGAPTTRRAGPGCYEFTTPNGRTEYIVRGDCLDRNGFDVADLGVSS